MVFGESPVYKQGFQGFSYRHISVKKPLALPSRHVILSSPATPAGISWMRWYTMVWTEPVFEEVSLCCEINSYASAKL